MPAAPIQPGEHCDPSALRPGEMVELAPAKVNLALHVTGRRADGYHLLDSLVVFADICDQVSFRPDRGLSLTIGGPQAAEVPVAGNLVLRAAEALQRSIQRPDLGATIALVKRLPAAAGIGGGSADAAAALRGLNRLWQIGLEPGALAELGGGLGADVPVCVYGQAARIEGIGEIITPLARFPDFWLLLANPGIPVPTARAFAGLACRQNAPFPSMPREFTSLEALTGWLAGTRNDLQQPAMELAPVIGDMLRELASLAHCLLARMSGSGATCFGLFATREQALNARQALLARHPKWWCEAGAVAAIQPTATGA